MARHYSICDKCGGHVVYVSENFKNAGIAISMTDTFMQDILNDLKTEIRELRKVLDSKLENLPARDLKRLYIMKYIAEEDDLTERHKIFTTSLGSLRDIF